jgi:primosomal protein N' (replication factor Y)
VKPVVENNIAEVIVNNPSRNVDRIFHYLIPQEKLTKVKIGMRVLVPFGNGNKKTEAFIINRVNHSDMSNLKEICDIIDEIPLFDEKMLCLINWMRERYLCTYYEAIKAVSPPGIGLKHQEWIKINREIDNDTIEKKVKNSSLQKKIVKVLRENDGCLEYSQVAFLLGSSNIRSSISSLQKKKIIIISNEYRSLVKNKTIRLACLAISREEAIDHLEMMRVKAPSQARILEILMENEFVALSDLVMFSQGSYSAINSLYKKGLIHYKDHVIMRNPFADKQFERTGAYKPTLEQENVIKLTTEHIRNSIPATILLRGVTGSGKTEVFLQIIDQVISMGKQAIVLVPEISLTPQMVERFMSRFGDRVAVFHSGLSLGERYDQWKRIKNLEVDVVVGARSAIFAPFQNLGIIILDEEHENSYKSELPPRYHAREVAQQRSVNEKAVILLSSATPSIESYYKAERGEYILTQMLKRYNNAPLPKAKIVDMREELVRGNKSIFSTTLKEEIEYNIRNRQQTILFLNRRGFSTFVSCRNCGYVLNCPHCNISLTYHINNNRLTCHYCGYKIKNVSICPKCHSSYIRHFGIGTQKVEQEIQQLFPDASVLRMDIDTTGSKFSHERILSTFKDQNIDILIGTQMVSKGLDFPNVTLVGILAADMSLNIDDFRSSERTFQLITQVCGRAGRGDIEGRAVIQTYQPDDFTIQVAKNHDYLAFYKNEIQIRKQLNYPPFCQIISILISGTDEQAVVRKINELILDLKKQIKESGYGKVCSEILGPTPAPISRLKNKFRWRALLKCADNLEIRKLLNNLLYEFYNNKKNAGVNLTIDINPVNMF